MISASPGLSRETRDVASAACYRETGRRVRGSKDHQGPHWPGEESELHSKGCGKPRDGFKVGALVFFSVFFRKFIQLYQHL